MSYFACEELGSLTKKLAATYQGMFGDREAAGASDSQAVTASLPEIRRDMQEHQRSCVLCRRALMRTTKSELREYYTI
jgi:hypothetical protein